MYPSARLDEEIRLLGRLLGEVIREQEGSPLYGIEEEIRLAARARRRGDAAAEALLLQKVGSLSESEARAVTRAFAVFFELANLSEDRERVRVLHERERARHPLPRSESIAEAIRVAREQGLDAAWIQALIERLSIELVLTAHPTEAKRRSVRAAIRRLRRSLSRLDDERLLPRGRERLLADIRASLTVLWQTELIRPRRPTVIEEVDVGLYFCATLWEVVPAVYRDMEEALEYAYPEERFRLPAFLRFGSWIGGDRDGNPNVSRQVTERTLLRMRAAAVDSHLKQCRLLFEELSSSEREAAAARELKAALERALAAYPQARPSVEEVSPFEIYRRFISLIRWRLEQTSRLDSIEGLAPGAYAGGGELFADLSVIRDSLFANRGSRIVEGVLSDWMWRTRVFGLHMARLDIRQESGGNSRVMTELLRALGLAEDWPGMSEERRRELLGTTMGYGGRLPDTALSPETSETLQLVSLLSSAASIVGEEALGGYVISMTHALSDVLSVLWLCRLRGLTARAGEAGLVMDIVPLFETIEDLDNASAVLDAMLGDPSYREHLGRRGNTQIVMIGYSDSTKDGGYLAACWAQYKAQSELHRVASARGIRLIFFHGRGGALGRGGGPAARNIQSLPPESLGAGLRVTEQGEVLADRYDDPHIAYRHLEQVIWATVLSSTKPLSPPRAEWLSAMEELSDAAFAAYRSFISQPGFMEYFDRSTPIRVIESLPIASRPSRRRGTRTLEDLRAIPWVFAWTQSRCLLPAWYGVGSACRAFATTHADGWRILREMYGEWSFFRATLDNAALALAKADMPIAAMYSRLEEDTERRDRIWGLIASEHERSRNAVLQINGQKELMAEIPWLNQSIAVRNPNTDPLNMIQMEWLRRMRQCESAGDAAAVERCHELLRLTVEGVASGMRTTG